MVNTGVTFSYSPTDATAPTMDISVQLKDGETSIGGGYIEGYDGTGTLRFQPDDESAGDSAVYQIVCANDTEHPLEVTITAAQGITEISNLSDQDLSVYVGDTDTTKRFGYSPYSASLDSLTVTTGDSSIATATLVDDGRGDAHVSVVGVGVGNTQIEISNGSTYLGGFTVEPKLRLLNRITSTSESSSDLFRDEREQPDYIGISIESDPETGDEMVMMSAYGEYAVNNASNAALIDFFTGGDDERKAIMVEMVRDELLEEDGTLDATFMTLLQSAYEDPSNNTKWNAVYDYMYNEGTFRSLVTPDTPTYTVTIQSNDTLLGTVDESEVIVASGTSMSAVSNVLTIGTTDVTATPEIGCSFASWTVGGEAIPATVTENITVTATFSNGR